MKGCGDEGRHVDGGNNIKDVEMFPRGRDCGRPPKNRKFNYTWGTTCPWLIHIAPQDRVHGYMKCVTYQ